MQKLFEHADFLIIPAYAPDLEEQKTGLAETYEQFAATLFANVTGQPALYLPAADGTKTTGFQLAGPRLSDPRLLALGEHILKLRQGGGV